MVALRLWKHPRLILSWVMVFILLTCTLQSASAARLPDTSRVSAGVGAVSSGGTWDATYVADIASRVGHSAVWTGTEMIIWGGNTSGSALNTGGRYDPATGVWKTISAEGAPQARAHHTAVWTGTEMIIWGGDSDSTFLNTGGRYNPVTDTWISIGTSNAPIGRFRHTSVWTGKEMIVWGGYAYENGAIYFNDGGRYDPATNTWAAVSTDGAPTSREWHTAVWTGTEMLIWGGYAFTSGEETYFNTGGRYSPADDRWETVSTDSAPLGRSQHTAVFWADGTGKAEMIVWGGCGREVACYNTGGHYDTLHNTWTATTMPGAPDARSRHVALVAGTEMLIWGGDGATYLIAGGRYDLAGRTWKPITGVGAPSPRYSNTAVWSGTELIIWGGVGGGIHLNTGGRYNPASDTWVATVTPAGVPAARMGHTAVWTGTEMIIWGGSYVGGPIGTGGRYDPITNTWAVTNSANAPEGRGYHTAVWTGTEMIVWGGMNSSYAVVNTGGRYTPASDTWNPTPMSIEGAPQAREDHTAVWTGDVAQGSAAGGKMIVWGGRGADNAVGLYDPALNTWELVAAPGAPEARYGHTAIWTGTKMLIWGGRDSSGALNTGGCYDPSAKTWQPISTENAPEPRYGHTAIWTGTKMIVWGGRDASGAYFNTGGVYDPASNTWDPIPTAGAPTARAYHTAVWMGGTSPSTEMIIWGGWDGSNGLNMGGRYNLTTGAWAPMSTSNAPVGRYGQTAVWTGRQMIIWGGYGATYLYTGGRYTPYALIFLPMLSLSK